MVLQTEPSSAAQKEGQPRSLRNLPSNCSIHSEVKHVHAFERLPLTRLRQSDLKSEANLTCIGSSRPVLCSETSLQKSFVSKQVMVGHSCNPILGEAETGGFKVSGQPGLYKSLFEKQKPTKETLGSNQQVKYSKPLGFG